MRINILECLVLSASLLLLSDVPSGHASIIKTEPIKTNQTVSLTLTQEFFNNLEKDVLVPAILNLDAYFSIIQPIIADLIIFNITANVTGFTGRGLGIDNSSNLI